MVYMYILVNYYYMSHCHSLEKAAVQICISTWLHHVAALHGGDGNTPTKASHLSPTSPTTQHAMSSYDITMRNFLP